MTKEQVIAALQAQGQDQFASMLQGMNLTPGHGVDFAAVGRVLLIVSRDLPVQRAVRVAAGLHHGRRRAARGLPTAPGRRPEAGPAPAQVLRRPLPAATSSAG